MCIRDSQHLAQHLLEVRAEGFPAYQVRPEGERETYSSIICLVDFTECFEAIRQLGL